MEPNAEICIIIDYQWFQVKCADYPVATGMSAPAGQEMTEAVVNHLRDSHQLLIGRPSAIRAILDLADDNPATPQKYIKVRGRNMVTGLPDGVDLTAADIHQAISRILKQIIQPAVSIVKRMQQDQPSLTQAPIVLYGEFRHLYALREGLEAELGTSVAIGSEWLITIEQAGYKLMNGKIIRKLPGTSRNAGISFMIGFEARLYCRTHQLPCFITAGNGSYALNDDVVVPDMSYKTTPLADEFPDPEPPLWVVEVVADNDRDSEVQAKRLLYMQAGILYWEIHPVTQTIDVYAPGQPVRTVNRDGMLDGGAVLPGFTLSASELWQQA